MEPPSNRHVRVGFGLVGILILYAYNHILGQLIRNENNVLHWTPNPTGYDIFVPCAPDECLAHVNRHAISFWAALRRHHMRIVYVSTSFAHPTLTHLPIANLQVEHPQQLWQQLQPFHLHWIVVAHHTTIFQPVALQHALQAPATQVYRGFPLRNCEGPCVACAEVLWILSGKILQEIPLANVTISNSAEMGQWLQQDKGVVCERMDGVCEALKADCWVANAQGLSLQEWQHFFQPSTKLQVDKGMQLRHCTMRSDKVQADKQRGKPLVLLYNREYRGHPVLARFLKMDSSLVEFTADRGRLEWADVVLFFYWYTDLKWSEVPMKYCDQLHGFYMMEPPARLDYGMQPMERAKHWQNIDFSISYRLDSDIVHDYLHRSNMQATMMQKLAVTLADRNASVPVAWMGSNCNDTKLNRSGFVQALMQYIGVASYGKCLHNSDLHNNKKSDWTIRQHKFYLSLENSICDYYVTEKFVRPFRLGMIPIVLGAPQTRQLYLPNNHSAIFVDDFDSVQELAEYLHKVNNDDALFESYLTYKTQGEISEEYKKRWFGPGEDIYHKVCDIALKNIPWSTLKGMDFGENGGCRIRSGEWWNKMNSATNLKEDF